MSKSTNPPPDQNQRMKALDHARSVLVQAPAGSGKTDLLTRRFLRLLSQVDEPGQIVAITFTRAAAAEMRHRILSELEKASAGDAPAPSQDEFSMGALALRALDRSRALGWQLLDLPAQLRITTIDSFCRDLALQQPLLTELGGELAINEQPAKLYRSAARRALEEFDGNDEALRAAIEALLLWRDNGWQEMEDLLVEMLGQRDRWMHDFVLEREPDWEGLRARLERPFAAAVRNAVSKLDLLLDQAPGAREEALALARFACEEPGAKSPWGLAECAEFPSAPFSEGLESARDVYSLLALFLQTQKGEWRSEKGLKAPDGFPATARGRAGKARFATLVASLSAVPSLQSALASVRNLPPARYADEDWQIVQSCFILLRHAAGELRTVFAEAGAVDFIEVAQIAQRVLRGEDGLPSDAALDVADGIHHLLVDEFQDTSRRQHRLLASLAAAWPDQAERTIFVVGDPMQSIYFFRDADAELFPRVRKSGLEIPDNDTFAFDFVPLTANFRTEPTLVELLNDSFTRVFAADDGSGVTFSSAVPAREKIANAISRISLHLEFVPQASRSKAADRSAARRREAVAHEREVARESQIEETVALIRSHMERVEQAHAQGGKYRIAVLGRARKALAPIALALREAAIPFRAVELEQLKDRPEVQDALALARALLNPQDRVAWLGVLRAPWCGLALDDLHKLAGTDDVQALEPAVPELLAERLQLLSEHGRRAAARVLDALEAVPLLRAALPTASLGTWLEQIWLRLGGPYCVDSTARANLDLLWSCLDGLPDGEQDLLGPALDAALEKLTALPDPAASSECGVQLMTIHKSKGLEFEVVIVPDLQAGGSNNRGKLLSWLERGLDRELEQLDDASEITEFLVAPLQPKGADRGKAKAWVDRVYRERESQEMRRILYVAATRAREELHFFARPAYKSNNGNPALVEPGNCLLATAWPALEEEVRARFEDWKSAKPASEAIEEAMIETIAASGESNLAVMPSPARPTTLRRLPADFKSAPLSGAADEFTGQDVAAIGASRLYERHEGGLLSRALGNAVHKLLEELSRLRTDHDWSEARTALSQMKPRITAEVRAAGARQSHAESIAAKAFDCALKATDDPHGQWILSPHKEAASEAAWTGIVAGALRSVRVDRVFRAGPDPLSGGDDAWWIVDYKTAHADDLDPSLALPELRKVFAQQLEAYAAVLRMLHGDSTPIRAALYYPRMSLLDWWEVKA
jgi:ATP-dependent helicase/nuclease subunit A